MYYFTRKQWWGILAATAITAYQWTKPDPMVVVNSRLAEIEKLNVAQREGASALFQKSWELELDQMETSAQVSGLREKMETLANQHPVRSDGKLRDLLSESHSYEEVRKLLNELYPLAVNGVRSVMNPAVQEGSNLTFIDN